MEKRFCGAIILLIIFSVFAVDNFEVIKSSENSDIICTVYNEVGMPDTYSGLNSVIIKNGYIYLSRKTGTIARFPASYAIMVFKIDEVENNDTFKNNYEHEREI